MAQSNAIPAAGSHFITLAVAQNITSTFRTNRELMLAPSYQHKDALPISETFNLADVQQLLAQPGCTALRIYYAMKSDGTVHAVLVAVDAFNRDILALRHALQNEATDLILQEGQRCPVICPPASPLNT